jgi:hydroxymethylbilane synthase
MVAKPVRIATRKSPLALWQAEFVRMELIKRYPDMTVELVCMTTQGDRILDAPLSSAGGKGLFIKELEQALLTGRADLAVHSMKDVTVDMPGGLALPVIMKRADPRDVLIARHGHDLADLPAGARLGTSSLRRQCQLRAQRPDLQVINLRGNVGTRLQKLDNDLFDAIVLAAAGVIRLGLQDRISSYLDMEVMLPAIGQGAIGIQIRKDDAFLLSRIAVLNDETTRIQVEAERAFSRKLYGGCQLPIAAYASVSGAALTLEGLVASMDGRTIIRDSITGATGDAAALGLQLAEKLLAQGADAILRAIYNE